MDFEGSQIGSSIASFAVVLGLLGATLWGLKKLVGKTNKASRGLFEIKGTMSMGAGPFSRAQLMLVSVSGKDILLGVTPNNISALSEWGGGLAQPHKSQMKVRLPTQEQTKT